jgi:hypothetical protein
MKFSNSLVLTLLLIACVFLLSVESQRRERKRGGRRGGSRKKGGRDACHLRELESCMDKAQNFGKGDDPTSIIATKEGVDKICSTIKDEVLKCAKGYFKKCGTPLHREVSDLAWDQALLSLKRFCDDGKVKSNFLRYSPCMHTKVFKTDEYKLGCNNDFLSLIDQIETKTSAVESTHDQLCCAFNSWEECSAQMTKNQCGVEADKALRNFIGKSFGTMTNLMCPKDLFKHDSEACKQALKNRPPPGSKPKNNLRENAITKYATSFFSFLFITDQASS